MGLSIMRRPGWTALVEGLVDFIYPRTCALCGEAGQAGIDLCEDCRSLLPWLETACARCALPLSGNLSACGRCLRHPPEFEAAVAAFRYERPIDHLVTRLKYSACLAHAHLLAAVYPQRLLGTVAGCDVLAPVPLHPARIRERGFNQAQLLAGYLARRVRVPVMPTALRRVRHTPSQAGLDAAHRIANMRHAFAASPAVAGMHVGLIDDVVTTGSTVRSAAAALKTAGSVRVTVIAVARAG